MRPLIGVVSAVSYDRHQWKYLRAYAPNIRAIEEAGGIPIIVPCTLDKPTLRALYERLDGILLPGGGDINPAIYHHERHEKTQSIDLERDAAEMQIARWAVDDHKPIMGICRGHQVMNVALGGSLIQDIPSECPSDLQHDIFEGQARDSLLHSVTVEPDSKLAQVLGGTEFPVNSLHHQSIGTVAPALKVSAVAPDGTIEGTEIREHPFALTVQWHPEDLVDGHEAMRRLFSAFVDACRK